MRTTLVVLAGAPLAGLSLGAASVAWGGTRAGNTALIAPLLGGPALLAAGWAILLLSLRHRERAVVAAGGALLAAAATSVLGAITWVIPVISVVATPSSLPVATIFWSAAAPALASLPLGVALAARLGHAPTRRAWLAGAGAATAAAAVPVLLLPLAQIVAPLLLPTSLLAPLAAARRGSGAADTNGGAVLPLAAVSLPILLFGGFWLGTRLAVAL